MFHTMEARISADRERLANRRVERQATYQKQAERTARRARMTATTIILQQRLIPAPEPRKQGAWERAGRKLG
jgi:hypothetical protein